MKDGEDWPERRHRHDVDLSGEVHYPDGHTKEILVSNLSLDGCRVSGWFRIGDVLEFTIPRIGRVRGQVRWALGGEAGIRFLPKGEAAKASS
nr:PilZ domain-containing protein [uncultured Sphingomonas sp.]